MIHFLKRTMARFQVPGGDNLTSETVCENCRGPRTLLGISWQGEGVGLKEFGILDSHRGFTLA